MWVNIQNPCSLCFLATKKICVLLLLWKVDLRNMVSLSDPASWKRSSPCPHAMRQEVTDGSYHDVPVRSQFLRIKSHPMAPPFRADTAPIRSYPRGNNWEVFMLSSASKHCKSQILRCHMLLCCQGLSCLDVSSLNYHLEVDLLFKSFLSKAGSVRYSKKHVHLRPMHLDQLGFLRKSAFNIFGPKLWDSHVQPYSDLPSIDSVSGLLHPVGLPACGS